MAKQKRTPPPVEVNIDINGGKLVDKPTERRFSSGSRGFWSGGKVQDPETGKRYQVSCSMVEIGSKDE